MKHLTDFEKELLSSERVEPSLKSYFKGYVISELLVPNTWTAVQVLNHFIEGVTNYIQEGTTDHYATKPKEPLFYDEMLKGLIQRMAEHNYGVKLREYNPGAIHSFFLMGYHIAESYITYERKIES